MSTNAKLSVPAGAKVNLHTYSLPRLQHEGFPREVLPSVETDVIVDDCNALGLRVHSTTKGSTPRFYPWHMIRGVELLDEVVR